MKAKIKYLFLGLLSVILASCNSAGYGGYGGYYNPKGNNSNTPAGYIQEQEFDYHSDVVENPFVEVSEENKTSNVSLTSSSFSYSIVREAINRNSIYSAKNNARIEEMLNYFSYGY